MNKYAEEQHFYLSGGVMQNWVGFFFYIQYLKDCLHKAQLAQKTCLTQWKRNVHKNFWDHLLLIIPALTKIEVFFYIHFLLLFQLISPKWILCKEISNLQLLPVSKQNIAKRERGEKEKIFFCFQNMFTWDREQLKVKGWEKNRD